MSDASPVPAGAGLKSGPSDQDENGRAGRDLLDAAAGGAGLSQGESDDLVAYYLSNDELPGDSEVVPLEVKLGRGATAKTFRCSVHPILWEEREDAVEHATDSKSGRFNPFVSASWIVARALVTPKLGPTIARLQQEASSSDDGKIAGPSDTRIDPPADAAHLLRRMFRKQSGALLSLSGKVLELSKLQDDGDSVREVEAAGN